MASQRTHSPSSRRSHQPDGCRTCVSDQIRDALEERIISGALAPGDRLIELSLAKEFATSQAPVREAIKELESRRLVESIPYRGAHVREISGREMEEAYDVRGALEQLAGELAAPAFRGNVAELHAIVADLTAAATAGDAEGYSKHNFAFHRAVVSGAGNETLLNAWEALGFEMRVRINIARHQNPELVARAAEHVPIIDALERGDGARAGRLLREHALSCKERWRKRSLPSELPSADQNVADVPASCLS
ncbi:GntR family transcriptional regulator [Lacipirellula parvula]|uniref:GntR family transcriptional regulator n=1 Tax=Lacipirellula parvula TaxID=2650471 RepID=UPI0018E0874F|nr:GntR family transcriptional regulator [Lacipirellula parvula]